jgi:hypothetical protein
VKGIAEGKDFKFILIKVRACFAGNARSGAIAAVS